MVMSRARTPTLAKAASISRAAASGVVMVPLPSVMAACGRLALRGRADWIDGAKRRNIPLLHHLGHFPADLADVLAIITHWSKAAKEFIECLQFPRCERIPTASGRIGHNAPPRVSVFGFRFNHIATPCERQYTGCFAKKEWVLRPAR